MTQISPILFLIWLIRGNFPQFPKKVAGLKAVVEKNMLENRKMKKKIENKNRWHVLNTPPHTS